MTYQDFIRHYPVSEAQFQAFVSYYDLLKKWSSVHNLVQEETLDAFFDRHILDSLEVIPFLKWDASICDVGTGAGFPGLVLSIMGYSDITLVEISHKKCSFLRTVISELNLTAKVINQRVESLEQPLKIVVCRAFAPIDRLLSLIKAERFILLKGENYQKEMDHIQGPEKFQWIVHPGQFSKLCKIIEIIPRQ